MLLRNLLDPMSRVLENNSLTLLDVRAAVEWVHKNIENFGGDRDNIMVRTLPSTRAPSNNSHSSGATPDPYANFDTLAKALGCNYGNDSGAEFNCNGTDGGAIV